MEIKTSEFFKNIKKLPPEDSNEFRQLIDWEIEKIKGGVTINGVYFSGWLYWHLNHWWIRVDDIDKWGNDVRKPSLPDLRDNEWIRAEYLERCRIEKKGYIEIGARQGGKSEFLGSYFGMNATIYENTQNLIICGNDGDLTLIKDKVDFGLRRLWNGISIPRLDKTWRLNQIRLGYKDSMGEDNIWSYVVIRNARDGNVTEVGAGTTAKTVIFDEVGKYEFAETYKAVDPAIKGKHGYRAIPLLTGTGGSFEKGKDAENFFYNPDSHNFLSVKDEKTGKNTGVFLSGLYRQDAKNEMPLGDWLLAEGKIEDGSKIKELNKLTIYASDKEKAEALIKKELELASKNPDRTLYLKQKMYYPITVEDCFLSSQENIFNIELLRKQKARLETNEYEASHVELHLDETGKVYHTFSDKLPISSFPMRTGESKDAPIVIYEFPIESPPYGLYTAGVDSYRQGQAHYSTSLGVVYIYKRMHSITSEHFQEMFVASYAARPDDKNVWNEQARLLIKYYNARTLCENDEMSFIDYMIQKRDDHLLEKDIQWIKEIVPNTTVSRPYGIHRSATKIRDFLHTVYKNYLEETIFTEYDEEGSITKEVLGAYRVLDKMLLEETIAYNEDGNFDRVIAAELAIALAHKLNPVIGKVGESSGMFTKAQYKERAKVQLFNQSRRIFNAKPTKLFY